MKAAILNKVKQIVIEDIPIRELGPEEALIKVWKTGICGTDNHVFLGEHSTAKIPVVLGHEFIGELVKINTHSNIPAKPGDKVLAQPYFSCGVCEPCISGNDNVCENLDILGVHANGSFAEYVIVPAKKVFLIPENMKLELAPLVEPIAVAVHDIRRSGLQIGNTVMIIGGGPIGVSIALLARLNGAGNIVISEINPYRIKLIKKLGFNVINPNESNVSTELSKQTQGKGFDIVFETSGTKGGTQLMTECVKTSGTIEIVGVPSAINPIDSGKILAKELKMLGVRIHSQINFMTAIEIVASGVLDNELSLFFDREFELDEVQEAMNFSINDQEHFKILINVE